MAPRIFRTKLALRRVSTPPERPPEGSELLYANASGAIRQLDDDGNDSALGAVADTSELEDRIAALEARPRGSVGPG